MLYTLSIMSESAPKFEGWMGLDRDSAKGKMVWQKFQPKTWEESDLDIRITHCGICASDLCVLRSGWVGDTISGRLLVRSR